MGWKRTGGRRCFLLLFLLLPKKNVRKKLPLSETLRATLFPNPLFPNPFLLILGLVEPSPSREKERKKERWTFPFSPHFF